MLLEIEQLGLDNQDHLKKIDEIYEWIREADFDAAHKILDELLKDVQDDNLYNLLKQLEVWCLWSKKLPKDVDKLEECRFWLQYFEEFESFVKKYDLYNKRDFEAFKKAIYQKVVDYYIYLFNREEIVDQERLVELSECLIEIGEYSKAEETLLFLRKKNGLKIAKVDFLLVNLFYQQGNHIKAMKHLKDSFFWYDDYSYEDIRVTSIYPIVNKLLAGQYSPEEINLWLPIELKKTGNLESTQECVGVVFKEAVNRMQHLRKMVTKEPDFYEPRLLYAYLYLMDQVCYKMTRSKTQEGWDKSKEQENNYKKELSQLSYLVDKLQPEVYKQVKKYYEW